jgi:hypothetical protein
VAPVGPVAPPPPPVFQVIFVSLLEQSANNTVGGGLNAWMRTLPLLLPAVFTHAVTLVTMIA